MSSRSSASRSQMSKAASWCWPRRANGTRATAAARRRQRLRLRVHLRSRLIKSGSASMSGARRSPQRQSVSAQLARLSTQASKCAQWRRCRSRRNLERMRTASARSSTMPLSQSRSAMRSISSKVSSAWRYSFAASAASRRTYGVRKPRVCAEPLKKRCCETRNSGSAAWRSRRLSRGAVCSILLPMRSFGWPSGRSSGAAAGSYRQYAVRARGFRQGEVRGLSARTTGCG